MSGRCGLALGLPIGLAETFLDPHECPSPSTGATPASQSRVLPASVTGTWGPSGAPHLSSLLLGDKGCRVPHNLLGMRCADEEGKKRHTKAAARISRVYWQELGEPFWDWIFRGLDQGGQNVRLQKSGIHRFKGNFSRVRI